MRRDLNHAPSVTTPTSMAAIFKGVVFYLDESLGEKVNHDVSRELLLNGEAVALSCTSAMLWVRDICGFLSFARPASLWVIFGLKFPRAALSTPAEGFCSRMCRPSTSVCTGFDSEPEHSPDYDTLQS
jgi:hypothetical protein